MVTYTDPPLVLGLTFYSERLRRRNVARHASVSLPPSNGARLIQNSYEADDFVLARYAFLIRGPRKTDETPIAMRHTRSGSSLRNHSTS